MRLDGQYGDAAVIAQIIQAGVSLVTRGRGYQLLEHPQIQRVLAHPPTTSVTSTNTGVVVDLFDGGWVSNRGRLASRSRDCGSPSGTSAREAGEGWQAD